MSSAMPKRIENPILEMGSADKPCSALRVTGSATSNIEIEVYHV